KDDMAPLVVDRRRALPRDPADLIDDRSLGGKGDARSESGRLDIARDEEVDLGTTSVGIDEPARNELEANIRLLGRGSFRVDLGDRGELRQVDVHRIAGHARDRPGDVASGADIPSCELSGRIVESAKHACPVSIDTSKVLTKLKRNHGFN